MKINCPHCHSPARETAAEAYSAERHGLRFACSNQRCQHTFSGELLLTRGLPPGLTAFSQGDALPTDVTDC